MTFLENTSRPGASSLLSHKWFDTLPVIPAKAGFQQKLLWIPAFAGKTPVVGVPHGFAGVKLFTRLYTRSAKYLHRSLGVIRRRMADR